MCGLSRNSMEMQLKSNIRLRHTHTHIPFFVFIHINNIKHTIKKFKNVCAWIYNCVCVLCVVCRVHFNCFRFKRVNNILI